MWEIILWSVVFVVSLTVLVKASDVFTGSAEKIGIMLGIDAFIIGATVVSIGTSFPELVTSLVAVFTGAPEIVPGNVIGSNIANIFLIMGTGAIIAGKLQLRYNLLPIDLPLLVASAGFLALMGWDGEYSRGESVILMLCFIVFIFYTVENSRQRKVILPEGADKPVRSIKPVITLIASALMVYLGANYTIRAIIELSEILQIGRELIAVTAVALGTSLPELAVTISAVRKKNVEMLVGNVLGSNIFNSFAVLGVSGMVSSLPVSPDLLALGLPAMIIATILFLVTVVDRQVTKWEGWIFLILYLFFVLKIFHLI